MIRSVSAHLWKAQLPIDLIEFGMVRWVSDSHPAKALLPIVSIELGMVISLSDEHL